MIELIAELLLELLLQLVGEIVTELGFRSLGEPFVSRERQNPLLAGFGYCLFGLIFGGLSLLIFPKSFVRSENFHGVSLLITPVLAGLAMSAIGKLRERQGKTLLRLDSFVYGFIFAFPMALIRFLYTT
jgi:hypothetical protein